jgi:hypothetical protein
MIYNKHKLKIRYTRKSRQKGNLLRSIRPFDQLVKKGKKATFYHVNISL